MKIEEHVKNIRESLEEIEEAIELGLERRQRSLGFHVSVCATEIVEVMLHKLGLLSEERILKHTDFSSIRKAKETLHFDFPEKDKIINLLVEIEKRRNILCYGKRRKKDELEDYLNLFNELKNIVEKEGVLDEV
ncbi:MAG TPA: hypothetical protein ENG42_00045 [Candidatus Aenigmarchaeota archaeon]|nr:MAG: hypothetical protein DRP03_02865 [Candidatus Aenigmarchaeota archaeon]HDD45842.1 hypothetical protein [Candidatus Aenigmarchaeota archaeon]